MFGKLLKKVFSNSNLKTRTHRGYSQYKDKDGNWRYSHRKAAENKIAGKIGKGRVVHHKDGNKKNNRWSNLWVMDRSEHSKSHAKKRKRKGWL